MSFKTLCLVAAFALIIVAFVLFALEAKFVSYGILGTGGVLCMIFVTWRAFRGRYTASDHRGVEVIGLYWHFVDLVWIFLFPLLYIAK